MLFVDDENPQIANRGKQGGAGADHNTLLATPKTLPGIETLTKRELTVQNGHLFTEGSSKASYHLPGESDLRYEDDGASIQRQCMFDGTKVDEGFS